MEIVSSDFDSNDERTVRIAPNGKKIGLKFQPDVMRLRRARDIRLDGLPTFGVGGDKGRREGSKSPDDIKSSFTFGSDKERMRDSITPDRARGAGKKKGRKFFKFGLGEKKLDVDEINFKGKLKFFGVINTGEGARGEIRRKAMTSPSKFFKEIEDPKSLKYFQIEAVYDKAASTSPIIEGDGQTGQPGLRKIPKNDELSFDLLAQLEIYKRLFNAQEDELIVCLIKDLGDLDKIEKRLKIT